MYTFMWSLINIYTFMWRFGVQHKTIIDQSGIRKRKLYNNIFYRLDNFSNILKLIYGYLSDGHSNYKMI